MRRTLLWASENAWLARWLPQVGFVQKATRRFMPGENLEAALGAATGLHERGVPTILTLLGENIDSLDDTRPVVDEYLRIVDEARSRDLDIQPSVKPTQLGLDLDPAGAYANVEKVVRHAGSTGILVWVDMEASAYLEPTLEMFRRLRADHSNLGLALQSYLYRTDDDLESLLPLGAPIRLVKGAYAEPAEIAYPKKRDVDTSYERLAFRMLEHAAQSGNGFFVFGTHDPRLIRRIQNEAVRLEVDPSRYEFDMLYGIGTGEQERLRTEGIPVRVLISYGSAWFPWYMRRLAERPANVWFVLRSAVRR
jgi:proline dehydrogenase